MKEAILVLGGAFNPIHSQHIALLSLAKEELEQTGQWTILGGYCAVAPENYVRHKLASRGESTIRLEHRLALVRLAMEEIPWLRDSPYQREMLQQHDGSASALAGRWKRLMKNEDVQVLIVRGADRMVKRGIPVWRRDGPMQVAVGRKTDEQIDLHALWNEDLKRNLIVQPEKTILLDRTVRPVSSSMVRLQLRQWAKAKDDAEHRQAIEDDLVHEKEYLSRQVMEYIKAHEENLYIDQSEY